MRFMMIVKATKESEAGLPPDPRLMEAIAKLGAEEMRAGQLLDMGGLAPSAMGARIRIAGGKLSVTDGPFVESKELVGGYAIFELPSREAAIEQGRRFMALHTEVMGPDYEGELEIRQLFGAAGPGSGPPNAT